MKIKGTCRRCGREFLAEQVVASGGACPWDGEPLQADYAVTLVDSLREAEELGSGLEEALQRIADLHPAFVLDGESVIGGLRTQLERTEEAVSRSRP